MTGLFVCDTCAHEPRLVDATTALFYGGGLCECGGKLSTPGRRVRLIAKVRGGQSFVSLGDGLEYRKGRTANCGVVHVTRVADGEPSMFAERAHCLVMVQS